MESPSKESTTVSFQPSWDCSQLTIRAWIDDVLTWIPTRDPAFAPPIEHGYVLTSHGRVVVASSDHAIAVFHRIYTPYLLHDPSPIDPSFDLTLSSLPPSVRSRTRAASAAAAAADGSQPTHLTPPSDHSDHFV
eukprot:5205111-Pleurochrysis_carterae.AAC.2